MLRHDTLATDADPPPFRYPGTKGLSYVEEYALLFGRGPQGQIVFRSLETWRVEWLVARDAVLPKFLASFPGRRPAASYITGEYPLRPLSVPLPLSHPYRHERRVWVDDGASGFWYCDFPEPYQVDEAQHLYGLDVIDAEELSRYTGYKRARGLASYRWEIASE